MNPGEIGKRLNKVRRQEAKIIFLKFAIQLKNGKILEQFDEQ